MVTRLPGHRRTSANVTGTTAVGIVIVAGRRRSPGRTRPAAAYVSTRGRDARTRVCSVRAEKTTKFYGWTTARACGAIPARDELLDPGRKTRAKRFRHLSQAVALTTGGGGGGRGGDGCEHPSSAAASAAARRLRFARVGADDDVLVAAAWTGAFSSAWQKTHTLWNVVTAREPDVHFLFYPLSVVVIFFSLRVDQHSSDCRRRHGRPVRPLYNHYPPLNVIYTPDHPVSVFAITSLECPSFVSAIFIYLFFTYPVTPLY